ncbi:hypothetical protein BDF20DRAFT_886848 [Mycotypha africana]|uniref:uncharacterized protein n=1 Tax=Mycotypha africana TaxID=64632 RepID=UPI0023002964|nr:uncharacterized protein BDF20DRAFT_886848 [Mycotypha africana]KAI8971851.1 hypothetical protein BDF20DRAFT_886848 [Mycotypha africana]
MTCSLIKMHILMLLLILLDKVIFTRRYLFLSYLILNTLQYSEIATIFLILYQVPHFIPYFNRHVNCFRHSMQKYGIYFLSLLTSLGDHNATN